MLINFFKYIFFQILFIIIYSIVWLFFPEFNWVSWKLWRTNLCYHYRTCMCCTKPKRKWRIEGKYRIKSPLCKECDHELDQKYAQL